jgi:hypothetical protein
MIFAVAICECESLISFQIHSRISSPGTPERSRMSSFARWLLRLTAKKKKVRFTCVVLLGLMYLELPNLRLSCAGSFLPHLH